MAEYCPKKSSTVEEKNRFIILEKWKVSGCFYSFLEKRKFNE